jgi:uncharacterized protein
LNPAQHILILAIRAYRWTISPAQVFIFGPTCGCRFAPTCSQYAIEAIRSRGILTGSALAAKRICQCHPFGDCGPDPVPPGESKITPHDGTKMKTASFVG